MSKKSTSDNARVEDLAADTALSSSESTSALEKPGLVSVTVSPQGDSPESFP